MAEIESFLIKATIAIAIGVTSGLLYWQSRVRQSVVNGWVLLRPTLGLYAAGLVGILMIAGSLAVAISVLIDFPQIDSEGVIVLLIMPLMVLMGAFSVYQAFLIKLSFNDEGIEYKTPRRKTFVKWSEMRGLANSLAGPYIATAGRRLWAPKLQKGFFQLLDALKRNGVPIDGSKRSLL